MEGAPIVLFIALGVGVVVAVAVISHHLEKKRREALAAWAAAHGYSFSPDKRSSGFPHVDLFSTGHSRWGRYFFGKTIPEGVPGLDRADLSVFEYHYAITTGSGKNRRTTHHYFTCAVAEPGLDLGRVHIRPEGFFDKIAQAIGFDDIDFEDGEFSRKFVVKAKDRKRAYDLLDRRMMEFLKSRTGWKVETLGREMLAYRSGRLKPETVPAAADFVEGFLAQIPRVLVNEERSARGLPPATDAGNAAQFGRPDRG